MNMDEALIGECLKDDTLDRPLVQFPWSSSKAIQKGDEVEKKLGATPYRLTSKLPGSKAKTPNKTRLEEAARPKSVNKETSSTVIDTPTLGETDTGVSLDYPQWGRTPNHPLRSLSMPSSTPTVSPRTAAVDVPIGTSEPCDCLSYMDSTVYNISYRSPSQLARSLSRVGTVNDAYGETNEYPRVASPSFPRSARPLSASRPHMNRLTTGLRESKPASRRVVIRDPEEIIRMRRKLLASNKTKPSLNVKSVKLNKEGQHIEAKPEEYSSIANKKLRSKVHNKSSKDVISKDLELTNIESDDDLLESLDELKVKSPRKVLKPKTFDVDDSLDESQAGRRSFIEELSDSDDESTPVYKLADLIPKADTKSKAKDATKTLQECKEDTNTLQACKEKEKPSKIKSKLDIGKKLIKKLYKTQSAKVAPLEAPCVEPVAKSEKELTSIAAMFCVESEAQASLRRYMKGNFLEDDHDGGHFKPGIWNCELADQEGNGAADSDSEGEVICDPRPGAISRRSKRSVRSRRKDNK